jgi:hypothetical protein
MEVILLAHAHIPLIKNYTYFRLIQSYPYAPSCRLALVHSGLGLYRVIWFEVEEEI